MQNNVNNNVNSEINNLNIKKTFKEKININALMTGFFALLAGFLSALVMSGFSFSSEIFKQPNFYISTIINFGIMMFTFNFVKELTVKKLKLEKNNDYYIVKQREERYIKQIRDNHLEGLVEEEVKKINEERRISAANSILSEITYGLTYNDIIDLDNPLNIAVNNKMFILFCDKRDLNRKKREKLRENINKVINGKFKYQEVKVKEILNDISAAKEFADVYSVDEKLLSLKESKNKSLMFLLSTSLINAVIWQGVTVAFWISLLAQATLILTTTISASIVANQRISILLMVSNTKCGLLNETLQENKIKAFKEKQKRKQEELEKERLKALELLMVEEQIDEEITENPNIVNHIIQELQTN